MDTWSGMFWLFISLFTIIHSRKFGLGNLHNPGPGFFFFWGGIFLGFFSLVVLISALRPQKEDLENEGRMIRRVDWRKIISVLIALFAYGQMFEKIGFIISTFLLMVFLVRFIGAKKWYVAVLFASCTSLLSYVLFVLWLQTQLPKGILRL